MTAGVAIAGIVVLVGLLVRAEIDMRRERRAARRRSVVERIGGRGGVS